MRHHLLRPHVPEARPFEVRRDLFSRGPVRARDQGRFEVRAHLLAGAGPGDRDAGVGRVGPGVEGEDAVGGEDAGEFVDAGGAVVGEVDVGAGEGVGDAGGGDALGGG